MKKSSMIKVSVPIIKSDRPLKTGIVREEDVNAYLVLNGEILKDRIGQIQRLVAVKHIPSFPFPLIVIDLEDGRLFENGVCIIESKGIRINKSYDDPPPINVPPS